MKKLICIIVLLVVASTSLAQTAAPAPDTEKLELQRQVAQLRLQTLELQAELIRFYYQAAAADLARAEKQLSETQPKKEVEAKGAGIDNERFFEGTKE